MGSGWGAGVMGGCCHRDCDWGVAVWRDSGASAASSAESDSGRGVTSRRTRERLLGEC